MFSLYLDCGTGISGDMAVAALLDAGADKEKLLKAVNSIGADGFTVNISRVTKAGLDCCDFDVILDTDHENHDHDMEYLYGDGDVEPSVNKHHNHRTLADINDILDTADASAGAKALAKKIFHIVAEAEAKSHGTTIENVHFHEEGAIDSIVDILSAAVCFDDLGISEVIVPRICDGQGHVRCQHGVIPVPVPAVMNIAQMYGLPLSITDRNGEFVTPTGAAFVAAIMTSKEHPDKLIPKRVGMGAGKRDYDPPGILRAVLF